MFVNHVQWWWFFAMLLFRYDRCELAYRTYVTVDGAALWFLAFCGSVLCLCGMVFRWICDAYDGSMLLVKFVCLNVFFSLLLVAMVFSRTNKLHGTGFIRNEMLAPV